MVRMPHWPMPAWRELPADSPSRMERLLGKLGHPERKLPPTIHVAGTNGKGSTVAFLRAMLGAAGYTVHAYTSPHIRHFNERIVLGGAPIGEGLLTEVLEEVRLKNEEAPISFFEGTTAGAFVAFSRTPADVLVMETGMGGRFDPTNSLPRAAASVITPIYYDHTEYLGRTLAQIAWHKAGIMRGGVPCVISHQLPEVLAVLEAEAEKVGAPLYIYGRHWTVRREADGGLTYIDANGEVPFPAPALLGNHQYVNAATAIAAITTLEHFNVPGEAVAEGLRAAQWPGRLERIGGGEMAALLPPGWELWFDGGHNPSGAIAISEWVREFWQDKPTYMIFGTTEGKELSGIFGALEGSIARLCAVRVTAEPHSYAPEMIEAAAVEAGIAAASFGSVEEAIRALVKESEGPARILGFGSFYLRLLF